MRARGVKLVKLVKVGKGQEESEGDPYSIREEAKWSDHRVDAPVGLEWIVTCRGEGCRGVCTSEGSILCYG